MTTPSTHEPTGKFALGEWTVDPGLDRLERGEELVTLEPRAMDLLACLARHAGETVSKDTILHEVWADAAVVEGVIPKTISTLRAALGDDAAAPTYILTAPRRGYRLVAAVRWLDAPGLDATTTSARTVPAAARGPAPMSPRQPGNRRAEPALEWWPVWHSPSWWSVVSPSAGSA